jgi:hypothetical protein
LVLSHDIDLVRNFRSVRSGVRLAAGELLKKGAPRRAAVAALRVLQDLRDSGQGTPYANISRLAAISLERGLRGTFNFMAAVPSELDGDYMLCQSNIVAAARHLAAHGFTIGFHPGYGTYKDVSRLVEEASRFEDVFGVRPTVGRQHYLRFAAPTTWRHWEEAGLRVDSTVGFADRVGFRCGTCHPYYPFDLAENRRLEVLEVPLIVMDVTLRGYERLTTTEAVSRVTQFAQTCRRVEGDLTLLWHNSSFGDSWEGWDSAYREMLDACMTTFA